MLYRRINFNSDLESGFGEPVQFVGVHPTRWLLSPAVQPAVAFVEVDESEAGIRSDLTDVCEELVQAMVDYQMDVEDTPPFKHRKMMARARSAVASGDDPLLGAASDTQKALQELYDGCVMADSREELSGYVDGSLLDAANAALRLGKSKGMEKYD